MGHSGGGINPDGGARRPFARRPAAPYALLHGIEMAAEMAVVTPFTAVSVAELSPAEWLIRQGQAIAAPGEPFFQLCRRLLPPRVPPPRPPRTVRPPHPTLAPITLIWRLG